MNESPPDLSRLRIDRSSPAAPAPGGGLRVVVVVLALVAVAVLATIAWAFLRPRAVEVRVAPAVASGGGSVSASGITANGYVVARTKASVSARVPGRLLFLGVSEGSHVRRGEVLARLENADYVAAVDAARARLEQLEIERDQAMREQDRARRLHAEQVISQAELDDRTSRARALGAQVESARAELALARANLENTYVRAPFTGTVLRKDAEVGEMVAPSSAGGGLTRTAIATMADLGTLEVEVDVNEAYIARVRGGQPARITLDAYPDTSFAGVARQVVPTADRQKATVQVKVAIQDRDPRILPEMGAKVEFQAGGDAGAPAAPRRVTVPAAAVVRDGAGAKVRTVENGRVSVRAVELGAARGDRVEVRRGLSGGEQVVIEAPAGLKQGDRVRVRSSG
jgi:RND family efflux transporter MFP subunit